MFCVESVDFDNDNDSFIPRVLKTTLSHSCVANAQEAADMRQRRLYFYLLGAGLIVSIIVYFRGRTTEKESSHIREAAVIHDNKDQLFNLNQRTVVIKQTPDLQWIKKLGQQALDTVPLASSPNCSHSAFLVILVTSSPDHFEQRNAIRGSWAKLFHSRKSRRFFNAMGDSYRPEYLVKTLFLLGRAETEELQLMVKSEINQYDDILIGNFDDYYKNLPYKTRLGLTWAYARCSSAYILKTDDDVFVNIRQLIRWLWNSPDRSRSNFYTGWCNFHSKVMRNKLSKWYVSEEDYSEDEYPPYCLGGGYLMSSDILQRIIKPLYTKHVIPLEDIFVGAAINALGIQPVDNSKFFNMLFSGTNNKCDLMKTLVIHPVNFRELLSMHLQVKIAWKLCD